jgi:hypothetical protein
MRHFLLFDAGSKGTTQGPLRSPPVPPIATPVDPLVLAPAFWISSSVTPIHPLSRFIRAIRCSSQISIAEGTRLTTQTVARQARAH